MVLDFLLLTLSPGPRSAAHALASLLIATQNYSPHHIIGSRGLVSRGPQHDLAHSYPAKYRSSRNLLSGYEMVDSRFS